MAVLQHARNRCTRRRMCVACFATVVLVILPAAIVPAAIYGSRARQRQAQQSGAAVESIIGKRILHACMQLVIDSKQASIMVYM